MVCRRGFLSAIGVGLGGTAFASRPVGAQSTTTVEGSIESAVGASIEGSTVEFFSPETTNFVKTTVENGRFEADIEAGVTQYVTFFNQDSTGSYRTAVEGVPILYGLDENLTVEDGTDEIGPYEVPEGYTTRIRFVTPDGNPIEGLPVTFRATTGSGTGPGRFTTTDDGSVYLRSGSEGGVELSGAVQVELQEPGGGDRVTVDRITVDEDRDFTVTVREPEAFGGVVHGSTDSGSGTAAGSGDTPSDDDPDGATQADDESEVTPSGGRNAGTAGDDTDTHRGFLTNDPDSSLSFLDDPVSLTWAGIGVSIAGIVVQLFGRQS